LKLKTPLSLKEAAEMLSCTFVGEPDHQITGLNEIHMVEPGDLMFVDHEKYYDKALNSAATTILIDKEVDCPAGKGLLISEDPFRDYNMLTRKFGAFQTLAAQISPSAKIANSALIQPNVTIGNNVVVGEECFIQSGVVIYDNTVIGDRVRIHANTVIGGDAFYYKKRPEGYDKMHTCGSVVIEDDVEIGALCTIDNGVSGITRIGAGSKLDNHVQIGHDTQIGKKCLFAAQVGVAGCVVVEDNVTLWGQVGIPSDITIGEGSTVLGQSALMNSVEGGKTWLGSPAQEARKAFREIAAVRRLPEIIEKVRN